MHALLDQFFNLGVMEKAFPLLARGLGVTLLLCLTVIPLGFIGGLLVALARLSHSAGLRIGIRILTDLFRALPPLVLLILVYSGLPFAGVRLSPFAAVCIAFFLNTSAYYGEVLRAGIESIGFGQWEAARSTGLS
jgi:polar amino acid transport system permease protein